MTHWGQQRLNVFPALVSNAAVSHERHGRALHDVNPLFHIKGGSSFLYSAENPFISIDIDFQCFVDNPAALFRQATDSRQASRNHSVDPTPSDNER